MRLSELSSEINICLKNNDSIIVTTNDNGINKIKEITFDDLINCLIQAKIQEDGQDITHEYKDSGVLGNSDNVNTIRYFTEEKTQTKIYVMHRKNNIVNINYYDTVYKNIHLPDILFAAKIVNNKFVSSYVCCVKKTNVIEEGTKLYRFPLSNVYADTRVCWGANKVFSFNIQTIRDINKLPYIFLTAPYNDDMYACGNNMPFRKLMEKIQKENNFDESILEPLNMNFENWCKKLIR